MSAKDEVKPHDPQRGLEAAIAWLKERNRYVLDPGAFKPSWGVPGGDVPAPQKEQGIWGRRR